VKHRVHTTPFDRPAGPGRALARAASFSVLAAVALAPAIPVLAEEPEPETVATLVVTSDRKRFSPDMDGRADQVEISLDIPEAGHLHRTITSAQRVIEQAAIPVEPGRTTWEWNGLDSRGRTAPDGPILIRYQLLNDEEVQRAVGEVVVTVDTSRPWVRTRVSHPRHDGRRPIDLAIEVRDNDAMPRVTVAVFRGTTRIDGPHALPNGKSRRSHRFQPPRPLRPGTYSFAVTPIDRAQNIGRRVLHTWRVERPGPGKVITRGNSRRPMVALTFDDCHDHSAWRSILDSLKRARAKASFFCPGNTLGGTATALARRTVAEGHTIGAHGWDHAALARRSDSMVRSQLRRGRDAWWSAARATSPYFRPPYGSFDSQVVRISGELSLPDIVMWDVDPQDWRAQSSGRITAHVSSRARPGSIVVLHTVRRTAAAVPSMLRELRRRGLEPVSLDRLLGR
jgi:peptidoglycan-N-acetylglucosamine deacetylase